MRSNKKKWRRGSSGFLLLFLILVPIRLAAQQSGKSNVDEFDRLWSVERSRIEQIAKLTAIQGGTILFTVDRLLGYASAGRARRLHLPPYSDQCPYWSAALSHDGRFVAFLNGDGSEHCSLSIYEIATGKIRSLCDLPAPAPLSWSWDDTEIAFSDSRFDASSIRSVSVSEGSVRTIVYPAELAMERTPSGILLRFDDGAPMQWSHAEDKLVVGFRREIPTARSNWYSSYPVVFIIELRKGGARTAFENGHGAQVSPVADRIAWYRDNKIVVANLDGTDRQILTAAPRWMLFFSGDFKGPLVWSPDGEQLVFGTLESETCRDAVYILQLKTKHLRQLMSRTCITIEDWR